MDYARLISNHFQNLRLVSETRHEQPYPVVARGTRSYTVKLNNNVKVSIDHLKPADVLADD